MWKGKKTEWLDVTGHETVVSIPRLLCGERIMVGYETNFYERIHDTEDRRGVEGRQVPRGLQDER